MWLYDAVSSASDEVGRIFRFLVYFLGWFGFSSDRRPQKVNWLSVSYILNVRCLENELCCFIACNWTDEDRKLCKKSLSTK
jgi:hypothetical protein